MILFNGIAFNYQSSLQVYVNPGLICNMVSKKVPVRFQFGFIFVCCRKKQAYKIMEKDTSSATVNVSDENKKALEKCVIFLNSIGIKIMYRALPADTFLPGLSIEEGCIIIDNEKLCYPGDILHEAAHIAIVPATDRASLNAASIATRPDNQAEEMMAIAWSYAACVHLQMDPYFVFHNDGYKGGGSYIADNFKEKRYFGLPMLQWKGMAVDEKKAAGLNVEPYPAMLKWMLD